MTIEYFGGAYGRPDPIIQLLAHKGISYDKIDVTMDEWGPRKAAGNTGEMGGLPIVHQKGKAKSKQQTNAILRSLGVQHCYYNQEDWKNCGIIDMIVDTQTDAFLAVYKAVTAPEPE